MPGLFNVGSRVAEDVANNRGSVKESLKRRGMEGMKEVLGKTLRGGGRPRKPCKRPGVRKGKKQGRWGPYNNVFGRY